jgi:tetratricopeptide (TPR) repeat protein
MKTLLAGLCVSFALLGPAVAAAQQPTDTELETAKGLFSQAQEAYNAGNYESALKLYSAAYQLAKKPTILFNIGQCHRKLGNRKEASANYKQFLTDEPETQYRGEVEYKIAELEEQLGNKKEALTYYQLYLKHRLETDTNEVEAKTRIAALEKEIGPLTGPNSKTFPGEPAQPKTFLVPGAVAAASFGASALFGGLSIVKNRNLRTACVESQQPPGASQDNIDRVCLDEDENQVKTYLRKPVRRLAVTSDIFLGVGILSLVPTYLLFRAYKTKNNPEAPKTTALRFTPTTTGGFVTFSFTPNP